MTTQALVNLKRLAAVWRAPVYLETAPRRVRIARRVRTVVRAVRLA